MADDVLDGLLHLLDDREEPIVYRCASEPHAATRRLMASLGVRVEVGPVRVSAHQILQTRDCVAVGCEQIAESGSERCRRHQQPAPVRDAALVRRLAAAPTSRFPLTARKEPAVAARHSFTDDEIFEALIAHRHEHGKWPTSHEWRFPGEHRPTSATLSARFKGWATLIALAQLRLDKRSGGEPKGSAAGAAEAPKVAPTTEPPDDERPAVTPPAVTVASPDLVPAEAGSPPDEDAAEETGRPPAQPEELGPPEPDPDAPLPQTDPHAFAILELLTLIRDLDTDRLAVEHEEGVDVKANALVRRLARAALDQADPAQIGAAVLAQLDEAA